MRKEGHCLSFLACHGDVERSFAHLVLEVPEEYPTHSVPEAGVEEYLGLGNMRKMNLLS
jgi:hypothetical protein